ncbi:TonB-dependent receptor [Pseudoduganella eburnea]|uniref:TonB-dependent receptor n=1 Tax=Massilia eburnea TaxID=1776165 RepID=A0A6L6QPS1_9BURK|nr:TonB-dependent receptor [Massilia eburnea]
MKRRALGGLLALLAAAARGEGAGIPTVEIVGIAPAGALVVARRLLPYAVQVGAAPQQGETLAESMARTLAGVNLNEVSGSPYQQDVTYRGFRASPLLGTAQGLSVYLDGVRVNEPFGDVVNWDMLPEAAIGQTMLAPGTNPLYGLNTLGGALVLATRNGLDDPGGSISMTGGSLGRRQVDLSHGAQYGEGWHSFAAATLFHDRGWRADSPGRLGRLFAKLGRRSDALEWDLSVLAGGSRLVGNGLLPDGLYAENRSAVYTSPDRSRNQLRQIHASLRYRLERGSDLSISAYARNSRRDSVNGDIADDTSQGGDSGQVAASFNTASTRQRGQGANASWQRPAGAHRLALGAAYDRSSVSFAQYSQPGLFNARREATAAAGSEPELEAMVDGTAQSAAIFASDTWTFSERWSLTASARYGSSRITNNLQHDDAAVQHERFSYGKLNPALGFTYLPATDVSLFANASQSNRVPTVIELGCADPEQPCRLPVGLQSDPYLKQVVSRTFEAGARWRQGENQATLAIYRTQNRDDILFRTAGIAQHGYFANFPRTLHQGADFTASMRAGRVQLNIAYSFLDAEYGANGSLFTGARAVPVRSGTRIAGLPRHTFKLGADWHVTDALAVGANLHANSRMSVLGNEDGYQPGWRIAGHALLGLQASYRPNDQWEWLLRINNATGRRYETFGAVGTDIFSAGQAQQARFVAPGAPRSVTAGLHINF